MASPCDQEREMKRAEVFRNAKEFFQVDDTRGPELFGSIHRISHLTHMIDNQASDSSGLSGPRWAIMLRLLIAEYMGEPSGLTPTDLSHAQRVSKNTISSLLRGLEEQGLIERDLDPDDLRVFRIHLTEAGRALIRKSGPQRIGRMNRLLDGLETEERTQLMALLEKLLQSLLVKLCKTEEQSANN